MTDTQDTIPCEVPGCTARAKPGMGMKSHMTKAHGNGKSGTGTTEIFDKVAAATKILVPDTDELYLRMEEVVELRKHMLRFLNR